MKNPNPWLTILLAVIAPFFISCGGGGENASTTGTAAIFIGEIQSIDRTNTTRIVVNGLELSVPEGTPVQFEADETGSLQALREGMVIKAEGFISDDRTTGRADQIELKNQLKGPITEVTETTPAVIKTLKVMGYKVIVEDGVTKFDDDDSEFDFGTLAVGQIVEVSGFRGRVLGSQITLPPPGTVIATFMKKKANDLDAFLASGDGLEVTGFFQQLPDGNMSIGDLFVDVSNATVTGGLNGLVEVRGNSFDLATNTLIANRVIKLPEGFGVVDIPWAEVEVIGNLASLRLGPSFVSNLERQNIGISTDTGFIGLIRPDSGFGDIDVRMEAEGPVRSGRMESARIIVKDNIRLQGIVDAVNISNRTVTLQGMPGVTVFVDEGRTDQSLPEVDLSQILPGTHLTIQGYVPPTLGAPFVIASRFISDGGSGGGGIFTLQGPVDSFSAQTGIVTILGVSVDTSAIPDDQFFVGEAKLPQTGGTDPILGSPVTGRRNFFASLEIGDLVVADSQFFISIDDQRPFWNAIQAFK